MQHRRFFLLGCLLELGLIGIAVPLGWVLDQPFATGLQWDGRALMVGTAAAGPLLALFLFLLRSRLAPLVSIRHFLETVVRPLFERWSLAQLAAISILAGVSEELLFRGVLQGGLMRSTGPVLGTFLASVLFGACHCINLAYATIAALIGAYLGCLWLASGNLLAPMVTHALYDFAALLYFLRVAKPLSDDL